MNDIPKLVTVAEAAIILRYHPNTIRKLLREGKLRRARPQLAGSYRRIHILADSLRDFLEGRDLDECVRLEVQSAQESRERAREKRLAKVQVGHA